MNTTTQKGSVIAQKAPIQTFLSIDQLSYVS